MHQSALLAVMVSIRHIPRVYQWILRPHAPMPKAVRVILGHVTHLGPFFAWLKKIFISFRVLENFLIAPCLKKILIEARRGYRVDHQLLLALPSVDVSVDIINYVTDSSPTSLKTEWVIRLILSTVFHYQKTSWFWHVFPFSKDRSRLQRSGIPFFLYFLSLLPQVGVPFSPLIVAFDIRNWQRGQPFLQTSRILLHKITPLSLRSFSVASAIRRGRYSTWCLLLL